MALKTSWKITADEILELLEEDDNLGICMSCGAIAEGVEPDATKYRCEECGERNVFGAEQALLTL